MKPFLQVITLLMVAVNAAFGQQIPLPEHPRPDFERSDWQNLNGQWAFEFDSLNVGLNKNWSNGNAAFSKNITVPFPWGSNLSGVKDEADIGWYQRSITVPEGWKSKRTFLTIGASDWETTVWLDGHLLGTHQGGYTPFSFDLTPYLTYGKPQRLVVRVDDARRMFTLYGKQGYGNARGIWQTPYLEARGNTYLKTLHFTPDIDKSQVTVSVEIDKDAERETPVEISVEGIGKATAVIPKGRYQAEAVIQIPNQRLWTLKDPHLYQAAATVGNDNVRSYFGMRKISVVNLPGTDYPYVALNNEPIYLELTLDQSYHPDGFYTFPSDEFMRNEIQLCKDIGLNGLRTHIKIDIPRKLYWADKLGLLVMADLPNSWGEPDEPMQAEAERTLREMIHRDYNHPAIFSWIVFNETWGLKSKVKNAAGKEESRYLPKTQLWVASMYYLAKSLDQTRLAEDNSICCGAGHTVSDLNSWHEYLPGYRWDEHLQTISDNSYAGSDFHFEPGFKQQANQPNINSECGNVWGYTGSTGDVDWSYDYHRMMNSFRMFPKVAGWLYTEHHDVINEWNGYWRFDRSPKFTGVGDLANGMTDKDFHSEIYLSTGNDITLSVQAGSAVSIPLFLSVMSQASLPENQVVISHEISGINEAGKEIRGQEAGSRVVSYRPWMQEKLEPLTLKSPAENGLYQVAFAVKDKSGNVLHRNFVSLDVTGGTAGNGVTVVHAKPTDFTAAEWSQKQWNVMENQKANGAGSGYFDYEFPASDAPKKAKSAYVLLEIGAKELFAKDRDGATLGDVDYMLGGIAEPSQNRNAYPMTDTKMFPSEATISVNGKKMKILTLPDDPADHRGVLSWHRQLQDGYLREAGSYGYLVKVPLEKSQLKAWQNGSPLKLRIASSGGGIAVYGHTFGRYPFGVSVVSE